MKTNVALLLFGALIVASGALYFLLNNNHITVGVTEGNKAINVIFTAIDDSAFDLENQRGKVVILDFITTSCPYCVEEFQILKQLGFGVQIVSINLDDTDSDDLKAFTEHYELPWIVGSSLKAGTDYKVSGVPTLIIVDKEGIIRYRGYYTSLNQLKQVIDRYA
jgi:cytochrome oxidase Cu insertion factor (SCO1/SenC/PrrC family)